MVTLSASQTEKDVKGLRPGTQYSVTLKVFQFYFVVCMDTDVATTGKENEQWTSCEMWLIEMIAISIWAAVGSQESNSDVHFYVNT